MVYKLVKNGKKTSLLIFLIIFLISILLSSLAMILIELTANFDSLNFNPEVDSINGKTLCTSYATDDCNWVLFEDLLNKNSVTYQQASPELHDYTSDYFNQSVFYEDKFTNFPFYSNISYQEQNVYNFEEKPAESLGWIMAFTNFSTGLNSANVVCSNIFNCLGNIKFYSQLYTNTSEPGSLFPAVRVIIGGNNTVSYSCLLNELTNNCLFDNEIYDQDSVSLLVQESSAGCQNPIFIAKKGENYCPFPAKQKLEIEDQITFLNNSDPFQKQFFNFNSFSGCESIDNCANKHIYKASTINNTYSDIFFMAKGSMTFPVKIAYINATNNAFDPKKSYDHLLNEKSILCYFKNQGNVLDTSSQLSCTREDTTITTDSKYTYDTLVSTFSNLHYPYVLVLDRYTAPPSIGSLLFLKSEGSNIQLELGNFQYGIQKNAFQFLGSYTSDPSLFIKSGSFFSTFQIIIIMIIANSVLAILLVKLKFWKKITEIITQRFVYSMHGKLGTILELTQVFDFNGEWFLESSTVNDYNFSSIKKSFSEIFSKRWRDVIFFPIAVSSTLGLLISFFINNVTLYGDASRYALIESIFFFILLMPIILSFWTPVMWIIDDCGIKLLTHRTSGDIDSVKSLSNELKRGFHTIFGFGAIIGIGSAISLSLVGLFTTNTYGIQFLAISFSNVQDFYYAPIINLILWSIIFLILSIALTINAMFILSNNYLKNDHIRLVKKIRESFHEKGFIKATLPKFVTEGKTDLFYENYSEL